MVLNQQLKERIASSLIENKKFLKKSSLELFKYTLESKIYYPVLHAKLCYNFSWEIDEEYCGNIIGGTLDLNTNPEFDEYLIFRLQGVKTRVITDDSDVYLGYEKILNESMNEFFLDKLNQSKFESMTKFDSFLDLILNENDVEKFLRLNFNQVFNKDGWIAYYFKLVSALYPDFKYIAGISDTKKRFLKKMNNDLYFGFEYDVKELKYQFKHGAIVVPDLNCILLSNSFSKKTNYIKMESNSIWSLCKLTNPFFNLIFSLENIYARNNKNENSSIQNDNLAKKEILKNGKIRLYNSKVFGNFLQKSCFYELSVNSFFNRSYLDYIEKSIKEAI